MKRIRMSGLCLVAACAMSATPAFAARCPSRACQRAAATLPAGALTEFVLPNSSTNAGGAPVGSQPYGITAGPDGNLWFTEERAHKIGRITPSGFITEFPITVSEGSVPIDITAGPDGNLWFLGGFRTGGVGRITPSGTISEIPSVGPAGITAGPDGNLWLTEPASRKIARMTPSGAITEFPLQGGGVPVSIVKGLDGNLWFTEHGDAFGARSNQIERITPSGTITEFPTPAPQAISEAITAGPDGNIWVIENFPYRNFKTRDKPPSRIDRITPSGAITEFPIPGLAPGPVGTAGPDDNVWFTEGLDRLVRVSPSGTVTAFRVPADPYELGGITAGPDGNLWFTDLGLGKIERLNPRLLVSARVVKCVVPKLKGKTLNQAKKLLGRAHCGLGRVTQPGTQKRKLLVVSQQPAAKKSLPSGSTVSLRLG